jgi:hypothetical protein
MKTGDETVHSMFDEITETKIAPDGTATSKRYVTDDETIREMDFAEACDEYVRAARFPRYLKPPMLLTLKSGENGSSLAFPATPSLIHSVTQRSAVESASRATTCCDRSISGLS